jgi:hypothetical protein
MFSRIRLLNYAKTVVPIQVASLNRQTVEKMNLRPENKLRLFADVEHLKTNVFFKISLVNPKKIRSFAKD